MRDFIPSVYLFLHLFYYSSICVFSNQWGEHTLFFPLPYFKDLSSAVLLLFECSTERFSCPRLQSDSFIFVLWYVHLLHIVVKGEFIEITENIFSLSLLVFRHADYFELLGRVLRIYPKSKSSAPIQRRWMKCMCGAHIFSKLQKHMVCLLQSIQSNKDIVSEKGDCCWSWIFRSCAPQTKFHSHSLYWKSIKWISENPSK